MKMQNITVQMMLFAVAALLIVTGCSKHKPPTESKSSKPPVLIEPNAGIDKVLKGMNTGQVEAAIGKPEKIDDKWWVYKQRGMIVAFGGNGVLFNIKCISPFAGVTKEGIGIGSTRAKLIAAYGNPSDEQHAQGFGSGYYDASSVDMGAYDVLWYGQLGINFDLKNDKVTSFIMHLNVL